MFKNPEASEEVGWKGEALGFRLLFFSVEEGEVSVVGLVVVEVEKIEAVMIDMATSIRDEAEGELREVVSVSVLRGVVGVTERVVLVALPVEIDW